jgi:hypothetical protein
LVNDIDLIYFDDVKVSKEIDVNISSELSDASGIFWSIKNQARMHNFSGNRAYDDIFDAMSDFPETISCVGVKINSIGGLIVVNMFGLSDLFEMNIRQTPNCLKRMSHQKFAERAVLKGWIKKWPNAKIKPWM